MAPEEVRRADTLAWLRKANLDLRAAVYQLSAPGTELWGDAMFHGLSVPLTEYAWKFRYPGEPDDPERDRLV